MEEGIQQGLQEGLQQGLQQGEKIGFLSGREVSTRSILRRVLRRRFGDAPVPLDVDERLDRLTVSQLEELVAEAAVAPDWEAFVQMVREMDTGDEVFASVG